MFTSIDAGTGPWGIRWPGWLVLLVCQACGCGRSASPDSEALKAYTGRYQAAPDTVVSVRPVGDHLNLEINRGAPMEFLPASPDRFRHRESSTRIGFVRDAAGVVTELVLFRDGEHRAPRISGDSEVGGVQVFPAGGGEFRYQLTGGGPVTVVLYGGWDQWGRIRRELEPRARLLSCEPPSIPGPRRSAREQAAALMAFLDACDARSPLVLVGHSFGGALVRLAAAQSPGRVDGLVLVDPFHEGFVDWLQGHQPENHARFRENCLRGYASDWDGLLRDLRAARPAANQGVVLLSAGHRGIRSGNALEQGLGLEDFKEASQAVLEAHQSWISGVSGGRHVLVSDSGHEIPTENPAVVVSAIVSVLDRIKTPAP